jgi:hypothetical protein
MANRRQTSGLPKRWAGRRITGLGQSTGTAIVQRLASVLPPYPKAAALSRPSPSCYRTELRNYVHVPRLSPLAPKGQRLRLVLNSFRRVHSTSATCVRLSETFFSSLANLDRIWNHGTEEVCAAIAVTAGEYTESYTSFTTAPDLSSNSHFGCRNDRSRRLMVRISIYRRVREKMRAAKCPPRGRLW